MFHKFKTTTYATLLLIGLFVLPYAGNVTADRLLAFSILPTFSKHKVPLLLTSVLL